MQWQRSEDPHGNPFLAIVIDPLRSLAKGRPEMMSFRVYPPDYNPPLNQTPDGTFVTDDRVRVEKWGEFLLLQLLCPTRNEIALKGSAAAFPNSSLRLLLYYTHQFFISTACSSSGACWSRYYRLETSYYMSSLAMNTLGILKNNFLWQNAFTSTPMLEPG